MAKSVAQLTQEIANLQRQVDAAKAKESVEVIARIREAIDFYGLTPDQLFGPRAIKKKEAARETLEVLVRPSRAIKAKLSADRVEPARSKQAGAKLPAKYSDGAGNSWSGRGSTPRWLSKAIAAGKRKEDFAL